MRSWALSILVILGCASRSDVGHAIAAVVTVPDCSTVTGAMCTCVSDVDAVAITSCTGTFADGATFVIRVPDGWNGSLVLHSQPLVGSGSPSPLAFLEPTVRQWFLANGYAFAGSFAGTGWAVEPAFRDQLATLDAFETLFGSPSRTIAFGGSLGGMISAGLIQNHPERFSGGLASCSPLAGAVGVLNQGLDVAFAIQQLLGSGTALQVVHIAHPAANVALAQQILTAAQATPAGRARIALAAALDDVPGWFGPQAPEPAPTDYDAQELAQARWVMSLIAPAAFASVRVDVERRAGGNPSWNVGVNYRKQLEESVDYVEVQALYVEAGLSLDDDLAVLDVADRISADDAAVSYLTDNIVLDGDLHGVPLLNVDEAGDGFAVAPNAAAYASVVRAAKDSQLVRFAFVHRAGDAVKHCRFTPAETITAFRALIDRIDTGAWKGDADPDAMNAAAASLGDAYNALVLGGSSPPTAPAFFAFDPSRFLRP
jgi:hypothetical protein